MEPSPMDAMSADSFPLPDVAALARLKAKAPEAADLLRQLANPTRLLILCHVAQQERAVGEMERDLGLKQPGLSQQLAELRQAGLVKTRRQSRSIYYSIADGRVQALMGMLHDIFCAVPEDDQAA
ncbi:MAG: metalloregulator ArsR/SmtB family transcription factor [Brevundimonas sp.]|nr:metalloregulator ArsR/SmtB family transcription factor [Brevundimonas sp.]